MGIIKKNLWIVAVILLVLIGISFFFVHYHHDVNTLMDFSYSYEKFDKAISDYSISVFSSNRDSRSVTNGLKVKANVALSELNRIASERISSLIKNDSEFMCTELKCADFASKELTALNSYENAIWDNRETEVDRIAKEISDLKKKRITSYAHFQNLVKSTE